MMRATKAALVLGAVLASAVFCFAQSGEPMEGAKAAAVEQLADQFMQRLHQNFDVGAQADMFLPDFAALHREYPGEFPPFDTPRISLSLLRTTDNATLQRKLLAEWNLYYWKWVLLRSTPVQKDALKALPPEFVKAAKKSQYMKCFIGGGATTLASPEELKAFLAEADQIGSILKKNLRPDLLASESFRAAAEQARSANGAPRCIPIVMGFAQVYSVAREGMSLVMVEKNDQLKLIALAPLP